MDFRNYTNQFSLTKTLRFRLIPVGKTEEFFYEKKMLDTDNERAKQYKIVKKLIDDYHKDYIDRKLSGFKFDKKTLHDYAEYYAHASEKRSELEALQKSMYKQISNCLKGIQQNAGKKKKECEEYQQLFGKEMITELLPKQIRTDAEKEAVEPFKKFTTYFKSDSFNQSRKNMYSGDGNSTEIAYRICAQNLPKFMDNLRSWRKIEEMLPQSEIEAVDSDMDGLIGLTHNEIFKGCESFNLFLTQSGIDKFNQYIGGYTCEDGTEIQGVNQKINLYCQKEKKKVPLLKPLFKQILSDRNSLSFIPGNFENDDQVIKSIQDYYDKVKDETDGLFTLLSSVSEYPPEHIFVKNDLSVNALSQIVFGNWSVFQTGIELDYNEKHPRKAKQDEETYDEETYIENRSEELKKRADYSLAELAYFASKYPYELTDSEGIDSRATDIDMIAHIKEQANKLKNAIDASLKPMEELCSADEYTGKKLAKDDHAITVIKTFLDSIKAFQHFCELFAVAASEPYKDPVFYGKFTPAFEKLKEINHLYDKVRNYITKKPYSDEKIKLNFNNPQFLGGWDKNKESACSCIMLRKDGMYYLAVLYDKKCLKTLDTPKSGESVYERMIYKQIPDASQYFSKKQIIPQSPPQEIIDILQKKGDKTAQPLTAKETHRFIDYIQKDFIPNYKPLIDENGKPYFDFHFKSPSEYRTIDEFFNDIESQSYLIRFSEVSASAIDKLVDEGKIFLFNIYNKDFSPHSHGKPNLHTMYFKALFDENNLSDICFKMNGEAEMFYRKASLKLEETTVHPKNVPIKNKNELNPKKEHTFEYDLIKDRRYTRPQFSLHLPITMNFKASDYVKLNEKVRADLAHSENQYIIGIDRGERNLLYVSVIDSSGRIVEQESLNIIENDRNDISYRTDYQKLLTDRENKRQQDRQDWKTIEGIKELKEGYLSQAVHKICQLVIKYNAVIVMENLNSGFKNTRSAVERSVYQKFEKMLTDKLAFLADKSIPATEPGGILHAYQLALPKTSYSDMQGQNGIIFYVDPWLTSKIDPMTGFSNLLYIKYESVDKAKEFFRSFDGIAYHSETDRFEFAKTVDAYETHKTWKIETYGDRIEAFRNKDKNSSWDSRSVILTEEFKKLFDKSGIDYRNADLKASIDSQTDKPFFEQMIHLFNLTVQIRNSVPNSTKQEDDYMISPVCTPDGRFYDSRCGIETLPKDADANGAYNIARKGLILVERTKKITDFSKSIGGVKRSEWLTYAIEHAAIFGI